MNLWMPSYSDQKHLNEGDRAQEEWAGRSTPNDRIAPSSQGKFCDRRDPTCRLVETHLLYGQMRVVGTCGSLHDESLLLMIQEKILQPPSPLLHLPVDTPAALMVHPASSGPFHQLVN